ncbi:MAG: hypothetical protein JW934_24300 [Anaerolineae bacterium]|nr:hypothetical protein [Anaerolineae bacterium]
MSTLDHHDYLFAATSFFIQIVLLIYFAVRKWNFDAALRWGWIVYALAVPAVVVSVLLLIGGKSWHLWLGGFIYAAWTIWGYIVDIARPVEWRSPIRWPVFIPYVPLYTSTQMFYWWPLATVWRPLWFVYAVLFVASTALNVSSHA